VAVPAAAQDMSRRNEVIGFPPIQWKQMKPDLENGSRAKTGSQLSPEGRGRLSCRSYLPLDAFSSAATSASNSNDPSYCSPLMKNVGVPFTPLRMPPR